MSQRRPFRKYQKTDLEIHDLAFEGKGISRVPTEQGNFIVFVPNTIPGQRVSVKMVKVKNNFAETKLLKVLERSPQEVDSGYFAIPGAPYINLPIRQQHDYKLYTSLELFRRIAKVDHVEELFDEFIPSPANFHYRNKMEYSFSAVVHNREKNEEHPGFALGFKKRGQWLSVEKLQGDTGMFEATLENQMPAIENYFTERGFTAWHPKERTGFCRFLTVKRSFHEKAMLINLVTSSSELEGFDRKEFTDFMLSLEGLNIKGLVHTVNDDTGDRPNTTDGVQHILFGEDELIEDILGLKFRISLESFFQTNPASAEKLYAKALDYVFETTPGTKPVVMDLFSGTGTITQLLAQRSENKEIIGVELVPEAVEDAKANAKLNGFNDLKFYTADVGKFLLEHPEYTNRIDTVVMDPPRAGIAPKTLRKVMRLNADRMVYISCNPATQARDIEILQQSGYKLIKFSLVDQFPHTAHIESVALFERK